MAKKKDEAEAPEPIMHTGSDTPAGQRDLAVGEQIAIDAGQVPGPGPDEATQEQEITDTVSGQDL
jgi:hypothetical protein